MSISAIFLFLIILLALVIVHEFGHFIAAKWVGMKVNEFAFGFPPRLFSKKVGETVYAVNALPLGGYVSIWGENGEPDDEAKTHPRAFGNRAKWQQLVVLFAGVAMNMLLAFFIFMWMSYGTVQMKVTDPVYGSRVKNAALMVMTATPNSPAYRAGIVPGSVITSITSGGQKGNVQSVEEFIAFVARHQNDAFSIEYVQPDGMRNSTTVAAVYGLVPEKKALGIGLEKVGVVKTTLGEAISLGASQTYNVTMETLRGFSTLAHSAINRENVLDSLAGPIGIARIVGERSAYGVQAVMSLVAVLSVSLAVFNMLPIPALDGGRIVVVLLEAISRKKIPFKYYSWANVGGFSLLMLLFVAVTVHDILGFFV